MLVHIGNRKRHSGDCCLGKTIDAQCSFYSLQFLFRCRKADDRLRLSGGEVELDLRLFLSDTRIILLAEHIACMGIGAAMVGIVFCADLRKVQVGPGGFRESGIALNLACNSDITVSYTHLTPAEAPWSCF